MADLQMALPAPSEIYAEASTILIPLFEKYIFTLKEQFYQIIKSMDSILIDNCKDTSELSSAIEIIAQLTKASELESQKSIQLSKEKAKLEIIIESLKRALAIENSGSERIESSNKMNKNNGETSKNTILSTKKQLSLSQHHSQISIILGSVPSTNLPNLPKESPITLNSIIHYIKGDRLTIYDPISKGKKSLMLNKQHLHSDSISVGSRIFIIGGWKSSEMFEIEVNANSTISKASMLTEKCGHSLCYSSLIYSIGGYYSTALTDCEKYSLQKDQWTLLPNLNNERHYCASFAFENTQIYALGGYKTMLKDSAVTCIEKLNIFSPSEWEVLKLSIPGLGSIHGIQLNSSQALIFGGDQVDSFILSLSGSIDIKKGCALKARAEFSESCSPMLVDGCVYGVDQQKNIHIFNISKNKWDIIKF